jgi:serine-aspartate repeat-containing protein C/D/E
MAFQDNNQNGLRDEGDALLPGARFMVAKPDGSVVGTYTTDGLSEPHALADLLAGPYHVTATAPLGYMPSDESAWDVTLPPGGQVDVAFSARLIPTATATPRPTSTTTPLPPTPTPTPVPSAGASIGSALYSISGVVVIAFAVGLIGGAFLWQRRRRSQK